MDKQAFYVLNDLVDVLTVLTSMVEELNPGATNQIERVNFLLERAAHYLDEAQVLAENRALATALEQNQRCR